MVAISTVALTACDGMIYDDEGDCAPYYKVKFRYDMNMKFADAFPNEVNSVTLYAVDAATGRVVWQNHESGERLKADGYEMDLPVDPGRYHLMAWCGDGHRTSFTVNDAEHIDDLHCRLNRDYETRAGQDNGAVSTTDLGRLYHGRENNLEMPAEQGTHYYNVNLTKNTNVIRVILQELAYDADDDFNKDAFDFEITDVNGHLESDNSLRDDELITYRAWRIDNAGSNIIYGEGDDSHERRAVMAELTVSRLMLDGNPRLTVRRRDTGEPIVFSVPLKSYCLAFKGYHYADMDDQEFLDREDTYNMVFLLDPGLRWNQSCIYINSFKVVLQDTEL
ncbi:MAG: FimB/Mfa2 family fimbrial subunit [Muribaculaceae bacterium]|nr:FimB/Mfa2 family fimbrial subunit [Muribaculaceae bacterium]